MNELDPASDTIIELKDDLLDILYGETAHNGLYALTCAMADVISQAAPSLSAALETAAQVAMSISVTLTEFDKEQACGWNKEPLQ
jgi:hypothetical protein